ncbi:MAG: NADH:ubiquinone reductase (Na(+)-transporting) subunit A [Thalassobius sp.]|nr:NADH:ubiquinone reductase (Na(+)-transporting) subunit A [Thalassovita sp.]
MSKSIKLKKGFTINLAGKAEKKIGPDITPDTYVLKPTDFPGMARPKVAFKEGDTVKAGTPILFDKKADKVMFASPVSGEIVAIERGAKRKLLGIKILADKEIEFEEGKKFSISEIESLNADEAKEIMLAKGVWPNIIQRPYAVIANPEDTPKSIFISAFDSHPLAPDYAFIFKDQDKYFQAGVEILKKLTKGPIHVNINGDDEVPAIFSKAKNIQLNKFYGKHPAGNVGVQIHHIDPINAGDIVWTLNPYGVIQIGKLFMEGIYDASKIIAVAGSEVKTPQYYKTYLGASVKKFVEGNLNSDHVRVISGNVLTGEKVGLEGSMGYYDHMLTIIPEGDNQRFVLTDGWFSVTSKRLSFHRALGLLSFLNSGNKEYVLDTNTNGQKRAFVMTGAFEKVVPMDIYPTHLLKAILAEDFDEMEALGIYEIAEEDLALCEYIDVSKHDVQSIVRKGINLMMEG